MKPHRPALCAAAWLLIAGALSAQPPEPLLINYGAIWAGEGAMILLSASPNDDGIDAFYLELGNTIPKVIAEFKTDLRFTNPRQISAKCDPATQTLYLNFGLAFDMLTEVHSVPNFNNPVYFSYDIGARKLLRTPVNNPTMALEVYEVDAFTGQQVLLYSIPFASFPSLPNTNQVAGEILLAPNLFIIEARQVEEFVFKQDTVSIDISGEEPVLTYIREEGIPSFAEGLDGSIVRFREIVAPLEMIWMDELSGQIVRSLNTGIDFVSHSVSEVTGAYYFHGRERVIEDPVRSGIYYTEIPVVVYEDDFTTRTEVAFRIAYPTEPPAPEDYVDHLLGRTEPLPGSPFPVRKRVSPAIFLNPDRNGDGTIDIADLVFRLNELAAAP